MGVVGQQKKGKLVVLALCFFMILIPFTSAAGNLNSEVQELLERLNKPPVKSIQSPDGDIIDCVPAALQPAFDHPDLRNHVIQMRPSSEPKGHVEMEGSSVLHQVWHEANESCPEGSVAVRRIKEEDVLRASSIQAFGREKHASLPHINTNTTNNNSTIISAGPSSSHEYAIAGVRDQLYYGTQSIISLWQPVVQPQTSGQEFSLSQLWLTAGSYKQKDLNTIETGWQVYPVMYGDNQPRLFTFWTKNAYGGTGCYNLKCPGFVQTSKKVVVGAALSPVSVYGGSQEAMTVLVWKDRKSNWWLRIGSENIGYWPSSLFTKLGGRGAAREVQWGGEIVNSRTGGKHTTTQMGSGGFPGEGVGKASFFKNIKTVGANNALKDVNAFQYVFADHPKCYDIWQSSSPGFGIYFYYGGPGRNPNCP